MLLFVVLTTVFKYDHVMFRQILERHSSYRSE